MIQKASRENNKMPRINLKEHFFLVLMLVFGIWALVYGLVFEPDPNQDYFRAPAEYVANAETLKGGFFSTILLVTGIALIASAVLVYWFHENTIASLVILILAALAIRFVLAFGHFGTGDVSLYYVWLDYIKQGSNIYRDVEVYAWPPPLIFLVAGLGALGRLTGLPLYGLVTVLPSAADAMIAIYVVKFARKEGFSSLAQLGAAALYLFNPASVVVSGMHIQFGSLFLAPVVAAAYAFIYQDDQNHVRSGLWLGTGLALMVVPVLFIPAFLTKVQTWRKRLIFLVASGLPLLVVSLPYLIQYPINYVNSFLEYRSEYSLWGSSFLLSEFANNIWMGPGGGFHGYARAYGTYVMLLLLVILAFTVFPRMKLTHALTLSMIVFYLNVTGFAIQYIIYMLPLVAIELDRPSRHWYAILGGIFAFEIYLGGYLTPGINAMLPVWPNPTRLLSLPIWAWAVGEFVQRIYSAIRIDHKPTVLVEAG